jgi:GAF domain-containing protein
MAETKRLLHIADYTEYVASHPADSDAAAFAKLTGVRTVLVVPMLKDDDAVGAIVIYRKEVRRFDDREIALIKDFAAQAVIAIENARLLNELRQRTDDLAEALEQQTATSEVLEVISSSPGDLEPVFATILENAVHVCDANFGVLTLYKGEDRFRVVAMHNAPPAYVELRRREPVISPGPFLRMLTTKQAFQIADMTDELAYKDKSDSNLVSFIELTGVRTNLSVPMLKDNELIGIITVYRTEVRPFADKQTELLENFAAQAVIAIENARLLNELRQRTTELSEALEQQTAMSEVLQVISGSPGHLEEVFASVLERAVRICDAAFGIIYRWDGTLMHLVASHNWPPAYVEYSKRSPMQVAPGGIFMQLIDGEAVAQIVDIANSELYRTGASPLRRAFVDLAGAQTAVCRTSKGRRTAWGLNDLSPGSSSLQRQASRVGQELRRASRHRHRERPVAQ